MGNPVFAWWIALCIASIVNVAAWTFSARLLRLRRDRFPALLYDERRILLWLSAAYVAGCAFRSFLPMVDVPRICLHDTWVSRILVGRSIATIAEMCFVAQWALVLREAGVAVNDRFATIISRTILPLIVVAELASWCAVLTTNNVFHAIENSIWTLAAALATAACLKLRPRVETATAAVLGMAVIMGVAYIVFMATVDVPMYVSRWINDAAAGHQAVPLLEGLRSIAQRCHIVRDWSAWRADAVWLSLYFTAAVWMSIALVHVPPFRPAASERIAPSPDPGALPG